MDRNLLPCCSQQVPAAQPEILVIHPQKYGSVANRELVLYHQWVAIFEKEASGSVEYSISYEFP